MLNTKKNHVAIIVLCIASIVLSIAYVFSWFRFVAIYGNNILSERALTSISIYSIVSIVTALLCMLFLLIKTDARKYLLISSLLITSVYKLVYAFIDVPAKGNTGGFIQFFLNILFLVPMIFITIDSFRSFKLSSKHPIIPKICFIVLCVISLIPLIRTFTSGWMLYGLLNMFSSFAALTYWIAIVLIIMQFIPEKSKKVPILNLESELVLLKEQYETGLISEDDYKQRKADILKKL